MKRLLSILVWCALVCAYACAGNVYDKVRQDQTDWSGEYLIVKEVDSLSQGIIFNGALTDQLNKKHNCFTAPITDDDRIASTEQTDAATFIIARQADGTYTIRSKSGYYIGAEQADSASMTTKKNTPLPLSIRFESDTTTKVRIQAPGGYVLRYNNDPASDRFRFYAEGKKKGIHLYKKLDTTDVESVEVDENVNERPEGYENLIDGSLYGLPEGIWIRNGKLVWKRP